MNSLIALIGAAQVAAPNAPIGTRIPSPNPLINELPVSASEQESFEVAQRLGACLVKGSPTKSMAFVMASPNSDASKAALERLKPLMPNCLITAARGTSVFGTVQMVIYPILMRGALAEALYRLQFARQPQLSGHVSVSPIRYSSLVGAKDRDEAIVYEFAQCVTDANPAAARALSISAIGSREEAAAFDVLVPAMSPCLYKGMTLKTDRLTFRFRLAEALYRWSVSATQLPPQGQPH